MTKGNRLGEFEFIVMAAVLQLGEDGYGAAVRDEIQRRLSRSVTLGAVYSTLDRLEKKGLVRSWMGEPSPERGGKAKRFFAVEAPGTRALRQTSEDFRAMTTGLTLDKVQ